MLILSSVNDRLQIITGQAGTIDVHVSWMDNLAGAVTPGRTNTAITTATTTNVVAGPAVSTQRNVKTLHVANRGNGGVDITVQHTDGTTAVQLHKVTVQPGTTLEYIDEVGFIGPTANTVSTLPPFPAESNLLVNSGTEVSQESGTTAITSVTALSRYTVDMIGVSLAGPVVVTFQQVADAPPGYKYSLKVSVTTADAAPAATSKALIYMPVEGYRCAKLLFGNASAVPVAIGGWVKAHRAGAYSLSLENFAVNRTYPVTLTVNAADTWEFKSFVIPGDTAGSWEITSNAGLYVNVVMMAGTNFVGTANTWNAARAEGVSGTLNGVAAVTDTFQVCGFSLLPGILPLPATAITMRNWDDEKYICERYYQKSFDYATLPAQGAGTGTNEFTFAAITAGATTQRNGVVQFPQRMRTTPTITLYNPSAANGQIRDVTAAADCSASSAVGQLNGIALSGTGAG